MEIKLTWSRSRNLLISDSQFFLVGPSTDYKSKLPQKFRNDNQRTSKVRSGSLEKGKELTRGLGSFEQVFEFSVEVH